MLLSMTVMLPLGAFILYLILLSVIYSARSSQDYLIYANGKQIFSIKSKVIPQKDFIISKSYLNKKMNYKIISYEISFPGLHIINVEETK
jgi:hypothetical protein